MARLDCGGRIKGREMRGGSLTLPTYLKSNGKQSVGCSFTYFATLNSQKEIVSILNFGLKLGTQVLSKVDHLNGYYKG
jgi:hypothetical protein